MIHMVMKATLCHREIVITVAWVRDRAHRAEIATMMKSQLIKTGKCLRETRSHLGASREMETNNKTEATGREVQNMTRIQEGTREEEETNLTTQKIEIHDSRTTREMEDKIILEEEDEQITNDEYNNLHIQF